MPSREIPGFFGKATIRFVCDRKFTNVQLPGSISHNFDDYGDALSHSGRLPQRNGAPVAAWLLPRIAALSADRFPFSYGQICGSDGDDYWILLHAFSTGESVRPIGSASILGGRSYSKLWVQAIPPFSPDALKVALTEILLADPIELQRAMVTVVYTALEDPKHATHTPYTLGWDGKAFVFRDAPEHAVFPEDVE